MGSRLHGNDGRTHNRHSHDGARAADGFPSPRERRTHPQSSFPRQRESTATHIVIPAKAGIHGGEGPGDGSPSPRGRRWRRRTLAAAGAPTILGGNPRPPISSFPRRRESMAGGRGGMGSRLHGNDGGHPHSSFPRRRESTAGRGRGMGPRLHGDDDGHPHRHSRDGGNPWRGGAGDGFPPARERRLYNGPSPRERRWAQRAPTIVGGRFSCPWRGSGGTLCCRRTCGAARSPSR